MATEWTPARLVGYNVRRARERQQWSQEELGRRLEPWLGEAWSKALVSATERAARPISVEELIAFSRVFDLPITWFLLPPEEAEEAPELIRVAGAPEGVPLPSLLRSLAGPEVDDRVRESETVLSPDERRALAEAGQRALIGQILQAAGRDLEEIAQMAGHLDRLGTLMERIVAGAFGDLASQALSPGHQKAAEALRDAWLDQAAAQVQVEAEEEIA